MKLNIILSLTSVLLCLSNTSAQVRLDHFFPNYFEKQRFAHRGGYANGPENTLQTIVTNIEQGVRAIEIDVMLTKDLHLVVFHDERTGRVLQDDADRLVSEMTLAELQAIPLRDESQGVQYICSLLELVDTLVELVPKKAGFDFILEVDFKPNGVTAAPGVDALMAALNNYLPKIGDRLYNYFFVSSFYPSVLELIEKTDPKIKKGFAVTATPNENRLMAKLGVLFAPIIIKKYSIEVYEPNMCLIRKGRVRRYHRRGTLINAWTANTACEKAELEKHAIAYTTNCPTGSCIPDPSDQVGKPKRWCKKCR